MMRNRLVMTGLALFMAGAAPALLQAQNYGSAVAAGEQEVFVGQPLNQYAPGAVYVYQRAGNAWSRTAELHASDGGNYDHFGRSLSWDNGRLLIGATSVDSSRGAAYVFQKQGSGWAQAAKLTASDAADGDALGRSVALAGDLAAVASWGRDSSRGTVYLFRKDATGWKQTAVLRANDGQPGDFFGTAIAIGGGRIYVGAAQKDSAKGAVYVFHQDSTGQWSQEDMLQSRLLEKNARSGSALMLVGDTLAIGAPGTFHGFGGVQVTVRDPQTGMWQDLGGLLPFNPRRGFGSALAYTGGEIWVGDIGANGFTGGIYQFSRDTAGNWNSATVMGYPGLDRGAGFGGAIALAGGIGVVGAPNKDFGSGGAVLLHREGGNWKTDSLVYGDVKNLAAITGGKVDCSKGSAKLFDCSNVDLLSFLPVSEVGGKRGVVLNDLWGWTDPKTSREYALVGRIDGTSFVDVTDPTHPKYLGDLPKTPEANVAIWRDIKVYRNYAFIVSDGSGPHGMQVFDLTKLRNVKAAPQTFSEDAHYDRIHSAHNIVIDTATGYAFTVGNSSGGETCGGGLHMINISDPLHPAFAGCFADPTTGRAGTGYIHDAQCVVYQGPDRKYRDHEICLNSAETALEIADVTDKSKPVALSHAAYPNVGYAHQGWLSEDQRFFFMDDELDELNGAVNGTRTLVWDVSDLTDPVLVTEHISKNHSTDHNLYIKGNLMYQSNYVSGLRVLDVSDPKNPRDYGFFDTVPVGPDEPGFGGSWSNYPFFKSGTIVVTSMSEGLFMLKNHQTTLTP